jgi:hypothetical protein
MLTVLAAVVSSSLAVSAQQPTEIDLCTLLSQPKKFERQGIVVRSKVSFGFEDFSLVSDHCDLPRSSRDVWLTYGGKEPSGNISTVNDHVTRRKNLTIGGKEVLLVKDQSLELFKRRLATLSRWSNEPSDEGYAYRPAFSVTATLSGIFLAAPERGLGGYGHLGCCHLLVIQKVSDVVVARTDSKPGATQCQPYEVVDDFGPHEIPATEFDTFVRSFVVEQVRRWTGRTPTDIRLQEKTSYRFKDFYQYKVSATGTEAGTIGVERKKKSGERLKVTVTYIHYLDCEIPLETKSSNESLNLPSIR